MTLTPPPLTLKNMRPFRLVPNAEGPHQFGGRADFFGIVPSGSDIPIQLVLLLDLQDPQLPVDRPADLSVLPLYYPFMYGYGGPEIQYAVTSNSQIDILYLSHSSPDELDERCLDNEELPRAMFDLEPLSYEQARILGFMAEDGFFQPNAADLSLLEELDINNLIQIGGKRPTIDRAHCRNPACEVYDRTTCLRTIATVPPISIDGRDEFWCDFQGGNVDFCFGLCAFCGTVIAFNIAT